MSTIYAQVTIKTTTCFSCHVAFGMCSDLYDQRLADHKTFYCPNGHAQHFVSKSREDKLREENERLEERVAQERAWRRGAEARTERERRSKAAVQGHLTRAKKRAAHGVCPCCTRTFANVARHIENKHPEFVEEQQG